LFLEETNLTKIKYLRDKPIFSSEKSINPFLLIVKIEMLAFEILAYIAIKGSFRLFFLTGTLHNTSYKKRSWYLCL